MKANSRKRVLISSVAMLLVALVALGTSTFAWFTQSPTAYADGLVVKATAAKGLKILSESQANNNDNMTVGEITTYQTQTYLNANSDGTNASTDAIYLAPASINLNATTLDAYTTTASSETAATAKTDAEVSTATKAINGPVYSEKIYMALTGASDETATETVSISQFDVTFNTASKLKDVATVALLYCDGDGNKTVIGGFSNAGGATNIITGINTTTNTYANATKDTYTLKTFSAAVDEIGTVDVSGDCYLEVLVYLNGEHAECKTSNIEMSNIINKIDIDLTIPTNN